MIAEIYIRTLSGYLISAFAEMSDPMFQELSGEEITTDMLPLSIRESIIPSGLGCYLVRAEKHSLYNKLGCGQFSKQKRKPFWASIQSYFKALFHFNHDISTSFLVQRN